MKLKPLGKAILILAAVGGLGFAVYPMIKREAPVAEAAKEPAPQPAARAAEVQPAPQPAPEPVAQPQQTNTSRGLGALLESGQRGK